MSQARVSPARGHPPPRSLRSRRAHPPWISCAVLERPLPRVTRHPRQAGQLAAPPRERRAQRVRQRPFLLCLIASTRTRASTAAASTCIRLRRGNLSSHHKDSRSTSSCSWVECAPTRTLLCRQNTYHTKGSSLHTLPGVAPCGGEGGHEEREEEGCTHRAREGWLCWPRRSKIVIPMQNMGSS